MQQVHDHYVDICNQMLAFPEINTLDDNRAWNEIVKASLDTSRQVLPKLAKASKEIAPHLPKHQLKAFLDKFLTRSAARMPPSSGSLTLQRFPSRLTLLPRRTQPHCTPGPGRATLGTQPAILQRWHWPGGRRHQHGLRCGCHLSPQF
jgi:hypothetical protein